MPTTLLPPPPQPAAALAALPAAPGLCASLGPCTGLQAAFAAASDTLKITRPFSPPPHRDT